MNWIHTYNTTNQISLISNVFCLNKNELDEVVQPIEKGRNLKSNKLNEELISKYKANWEQSLNGMKQQKLQALLNKKQNLKRRLLHKVVKDKMEKIYKVDLKSMKLNEAGNIIEKKGKYDYYYLMKFENISLVK